ncbi:DUF6766 family protein [Streptomyces sp. NPDC048550]|uniref:DUF6766 family protein n=1 Tax=Streptomyces sp. NPDC048550 TaxID=3155739 RepID=UPI00343FC401
MVCRRRGGFAGVRVAQVGGRSVLREEKSCEADPHVRAGPPVRAATRRAARAALCAGAVGALLAGCGASAARVDGARAAGERFERALASSDLLAVAAMVILSVCLRQRGSPESKPAGAPHPSTGVEG